MIVSLQIKPLSVNVCWQGKRFKTKAYQAYEKEVLLRLPMLRMPEPPYRFTYEFGLSNMQSDVDNPTKPLQDILSKKYGFNDNQIIEAVLRKVKVKKGEEYFTVTVETITH
jgi:Holliday junction resolvase RusA-like endonuclease